MPQSQRVKSMKIILILEDDRRVLDLLALILASRGYAVIAAATAEEALQRAAGCEPIVDLLIADIVLTFSSGIRVGAQLRQRLPRLKILLISGYPVDAWRDQDCADLNDLPAEAWSILQKPFLPESLIQKVGQLLGSGEDYAVPRIQQQNTIG
jgi:two-component system cell cycle sensor histidine kinase/response regulator CckA